MLLFCPVCGNLLTIVAVHADQLPDDEQHRAGKNHFECRTCPYQMMLEGTFYEKKQMIPKEVEDVLGGAESWKNVDKVPVNCADPTCESQEAFFRQVQIRSADEPMTTFYRCCKCAKDWREN
ncbi:DNA-directed RNA polymerase III subunit RPC10-like protein [Elsinoe fawcettii]|nr:DNA-directed RNA polymerase III subunit RPC10-like protein [Elsinoe fawcettii]